MRIILLSILFLMILLVSNSISVDVFFDFNEAGNNDTTWTGWEYCDGSVSGCVSYSNPGWKRDNYVIVNSVPLPRSFMKGDYGNNSLAVLDTEMLPPSTNSGASFKVYDDGTGSQYQPSWWVWEAAGNMLQEGITTAAADRMSMYLYIEGMDSITNPNVDGYTFEWGTYTCWEGGAFNGDSCPTESDNGHWYHQLTVATNMWVHVLFDEHPSHRRGENGYPPNNPTLVQYGKDYFAHLNKQYMQFQQDVATPNTSAFWIDELTFTSTAEMGESNQNDESITSLWVGYDTTDGHWEIGWNDMAAESDGEIDSEFEIRWSTAPITNANYSAATIVQPMDFVVNGNHIHKSNRWNFVLWTKFDLPAGAESNSKLYFAVKDVSVADATYKYKDSVSPYVHTIDYALPNLIPKISKPNNLRIESF